MQGQRTESQDQKHLTGILNADLAATLEAAGAVPQPPQPTALGQHIHVGPVARRALISQLRARLTRTAWRIDSGAESLTLAEFDDMIDRAQDIRDWLDSLGGLADGTELESGPALQPRTTYLRALIEETRAELTSSAHPDQDGTTTDEREALAAINALAAELETQSHATTFGTEDAGAAPQPPAVCELCDQPATHTRDQRTGEPETLCETHAQWESAREQGSAHTALLLLQAAIWACQDVMDDGDVLEGVRQAMDVNYPRPIYESEPELPGWALGTLAEDTRYQCIGDAVICPAETSPVTTPETARFTGGWVVIPEKLRAIIREGLTEEVAGEAADLSHHEDATRVSQARRRMQAGWSLLDAITTTERTAPQQLIVTASQSERLASAADYMAAGLKDSVGFADDAREIIEIGRTLQCLQAFRATIPTADARCPMTTATTPAGKAERRGEK